MASTLKVAVLIPALNASETIVPLIRGIVRFVPRGHIIVVDDGSTDDTGKLAQDAGAMVIRHAENRGKGAALQTGFRHIIKSQYQGVIVLDADGQHDPAEIAKFLHAHGERQADLIIGARTFREMPFARRIANTLGTWALS